MKSSSVDAPVANKKFSLGSIGIAESVKSGDRISKDTEAQVETQSQFNKFHINKLGSILMNLVPEDRVKIIVTKAPTIDGKFLIVKAGRDVSEAAKVISPTKAEGNGALLFNYSGVYSRIAQGDVDAVETSANSFVEGGTAIERAKAVYLDHKMVYSLVEVEDFTAESPLVDPVTGAQYPQVFALVSPKSVAVDLTKVVATRTKKVVAPVADANVNEAVNQAGTETAETIEA